MSRLLLEIGVEELPARFIAPAMEQLAANGRTMLESARLRPGEIRVSATPRRLSMMVDTVLDQQPDDVREVKGPPVKAAFDAQGNPTKAAEGFARGQGVSVGDLYRAQVEGGEYVFARVEEKGRPALEVLSSVLPGLILSLNFPKAMRWADLDIRWARPIRWIVALLGPDIVEFTLGGVKSGRETYGLRFLHPDPVAIPSPDQYAGLLREAHVILDQQERYRLIRGQVAAAAGQEGGRVDQDDDELFQEVTHINEFPSVVVGRFDHRYLALPVEVVTTPMRLHQRFFPVFGADGKLLPLFITIRNGLPDELGYVRQGNEKVLAARLADAAFFFEEDRRVALEDRLTRLETLVFQEKLGTVRARVARLEKLASMVAASLGFDESCQSVAARAAHLSKSDLVTSMVFEFPELQGVMGYHYALAEGEPQAVAQAIDEQYRPRFAGGVLPASPSGAALALADKIDALIGYFGLGLIPSGSQDPFALRRAALGIVAILRHGEWCVDLEGIFAQAYELYKGTDFRNDRLTTLRLLDEFFRGRLRVALMDEGFRYDLIDAALGAGKLDPCALFRRVAALQQQAGTPEFAESLAAYTRASNLAAKSETDRVDPSGLPEEADRRLLAAYQDAEKTVHIALEKGEVGDALAALAALRAPIDVFFDAVLVMTPEEETRRNRLALLRAIVNLFGQLGEWSRIVGPEPAK